MNIPYFKEDVFQTFNVSHRQGWEILHDNSSSRRSHNDSNQEETRGRKSLITSRKIREMERLLEEESIEARALTWEQLGYEVGLNCTGRTIQRAMGTMDYHKCITCRKGWVNKKSAKNRVNWAEFMLHKYPEPEDWHRVRFSDEVHFGWGSQGKLRIICQPGTRYCQNCIQETD